MAERQVRGPIGGGIAGRWARDFDNGTDSSGIEIVDGDELTKLVEQAGGPCRGGAEKARVDALHKELIEHIAESDDTLLEKYFDEGGLSEDVLRSGIHPALQKRVFVPLFCTSGETNVGVARLLELLSEEIDIALALCGARSPADLTSDLVS